MTSYFDGLATTLNDVFGDVVRHTPQVGSARDIQGVFRAEPVEILDEERGAVLMLSPSLRVLKDIGADITSGDQITADGSDYIVLNSLPSGSPADDAFVMFELEDAT